MGKPTASTIEVLKNALRFKKEGFQLVEGNPQTTLYRDNLTEMLELFKKKAKKAKNKILLSAEPISRPRGAKNRADKMPFDYVPMIDKYLGDSFSLKGIHHLANVCYIAEYNDAEVKELLEALTTLK